MAGDLRLWRKRWWGTYVLGAACLLGFTALLFGIVGLDPFNWVAAVFLALLQVFVLLLLLAVYAPWSCHWARRACAGYLLVLTLAGFVLQFSGVAPNSTDPLPVRWIVTAVQVALVFVLLKVVITPRSAVCPYDDQGRHRSPVTFRFVPPPAASVDAGAGAQAAACQAVFAGIERMRTPGVAVDLRSGRVGEAWVEVRIAGTLAVDEVIADIEEELHSQGIAATRLPAG